MIRLPQSGSARRRFAGPALVAVCLAASLVAALPAAAATDDGVRSAEERLEQARQRSDELSRALDAAAESYELANAHQQRLTDELDVADARVDAAGDAVVTAEQQLADRVTTAYKHPANTTALTDAVLLAQDAGSAMHRAALFSRIVSGSADELEQVEWAADLTVNDARQGYVVAAGTQASLEQWRARAGELESALDAARTDVVTAEDGVVTAREEAAERAAAAEAAAAAARAAQLAPASGDGVYTSGPALPPQIIDGKTCPVGTPNGFIDSWGFPRSGGRSHEGVDMFAPYGTPLYAVADGEIYRVYNNALGGLAINLIDVDGNMYYYAHLSADYVEAGQQVRAGDVIGSVGTSGNAAGTPPHLHWQFHPGNGAPVNPFPLAQALCR